MTHQESWLQTSDGAALFYQSWCPDEPPRGVILVVHGVAEHGGRYAGFARLACAAGIGVATVDLPGHGRSAGPRCVVRDFSCFLEAVNIAKHRASEECGQRRAGHAFAGDAPVMLLGHSMGGLIAARYLQRHQGIAGAIFSGAALTVEPAPLGFQIKLVSLLAKWFPSLGLLKLDGTKISRDAAVVKDYFDDPLVHTGKLSASVLSAMFQAMADAQRELPSIKVPVLILHGTEDELVPPRASELLHKGVSSSDKTLCPLSGLHHEILNEPEREEVIGRILDWAGKRFLGEEA